MGGSGGAGVGAVAQGLALEPELELVKLVVRVALTGATVVVETTQAGVLAAVPLVLAGVLVRGLAQAREPVRVQELEMVTLVTLVLVQAG